MAPMASPLASKAAKFNEIIDLVLKDQTSQDDSTLHGTLNSFGLNRSSYNLAAHKVKPIL